MGKGLGKEKNLLSTSVVFEHFFCNECTVMYNVIHYFIMHFNVKLFNTQNSLIGVTNIRRKFSPDEMIIAPTMNEFFSLTSTQEKAEFRLM